MRIANVGGRAILVKDDRNIDVHAASAGRFGPDLVGVHENWAFFQAWASGVVDDDGLVAEAGPGTGALGAPSPRPRQVFAIGLNYAHHAEESGFTAPEAPVVFTKFPSCIVGPEHALHLPRGNVDWEAELVVVIGVHSHRIAREQAWGVVAGLTVGQDLSERVLQRSGPAPQFGLAKSFPGFGPTGPVLVTPEELGDPDDLLITCELNGEIVQQARTSQMLFPVPVPALVAWISHVTPLYPGDLIFTGTPSGIGMSRTPARFLAKGDHLVTSIDGIGSMTQRVLADGVGGPSAAVLGAPRGAA